MNAITDSARLTNLLHICINENSSLFIDSLNIEDYVEKIKNRAINYIYEENGKDIGLISFYANDLESKTAYISLIFVLNDFKGKGVSIALINKCIETCCLLGMKQIKLEVSKENFRAINFYKYNNFELTNECTANTFYMRKSLT